LYHLIPITNKEIRPRYIYLQRHMASQMSPVLALRPGGQS
jgi:hypothetical protein